MARLPSKVLKFGAKKGAEFWTRLLIRRGFSSDDLSEDHSYAKKVMGISGKDSAEASTPDITIPTMEQPKKEYKGKSKDNLATINKQLDKLIKTAGDIGLLSQKQQDQMLDELKQAKRVKKEADLEKKSAPKPVAGQTNTDALAPLNNAIDDLSKIIAKLSDVIQEKQEEQVTSKINSFVETFLDRQGYGHSYRKDKERRAERRALKNRVPTIEERMAKFKPEQFLDKRGKPLNASHIPLRLKKLEEGVKNNTWLRRSARSVAGTRAVKAVTSSRIASTMTGGLRKAATKTVGALGMNTVRAAVKRSAAPLVKKALGSTALKSIPIIGTAAALGFAVSRLVDGDVVGAGLDAVSGLGGPLTAIPALIASIARDVYSNVYGVAPEQDPKFVDHIKPITAAVKELVADELTPKVQTKSKPTQKAVDDRLTPKPPTQGTPPKRVNAPTMSPPRPTPAPTISKSGGGSVFPPSMPKSKPSAAAAPVSFSGGSAASVSPPAERIAPSTDTGMQLMAAGEAEQKPTVDVYNVDGTARTMPSRNPTTRTFARGVGNVPDPVYYHSLGSQLYFDVRV